MILPGAQDFMSRLRKNSIPFILLTNDGSNSPEEKCSHFLKRGLEFFPPEIVSCSHPLGAVAFERTLTGKKVFVMGSLGDPCYGAAAGMVPVKDVSKIDECAAVIMGEKEYDWEKAVNGVVNYFAAHPLSPLIVPNPDEVFVGRNQKLMLAPGAVVKLITGTLKGLGIVIDPIFLGKPYSRIFQYGHEILEKQIRKTIEKQRVMMIGDSLAGDVAGGRTFGYSTSLVLTGITLERMLAASEIKPDFAFRGL